MNCVACVSLSFSGIERLLGYIESRKQFNTRTLALFPKSKGVLDRIFRMTEAPLLDAQVDKGILFGRQFNLHTHKRKS